MPSHGSAPSRLTLFYRTLGVPGTTGREQSPPGLAPPGAAVLGGKTEGLQLVSGFQE